MPSFFFICLTILIITSQRLAADETTSTNPPAEQPWTLEQVTNVLRELEVTWEQSPRQYRSQVNHLLASVPDNPHAHKILFAGLPKHPLPYDDAVRMRRTTSLVLTKWGYLYNIATDDLYSGCALETWEALASMVGWMRIQIMPDYQWHEPLEAKFTTMAEKEQARLDRIRKSTELITGVVTEEEVGRRHDMDYFQLSLRNLVKTWEKFRLSDIRYFAASLPPDERKRFLDKIKELARSDEEEAKRLDEPIPVVRPGLPVEFARSHASRLQPHARKQFLDMAKKEADYTEEELKILDVPYE